MASQASSTDRPHARADAGKNRRAVRGALFGGQRFDRMAVDTRLNLTPDGGPRAAAADADARHRHAEFREDRERVARLNATPSRTARTTCPRV